MLSLYVSHACRSRASISASLRALWSEMYVVILSSLLVRLASKAIVPRIAARTPPLGTYLLRVENFQLRSASASGFPPSSTMAAASLTE